jgi:serine/threonine protein kinase
MTDALSHSFKGTRRGYMAPEIHAVRSDSSKHYDPKAADVFALGVVLFALVLGRLPFEFALPEDKIYTLLSSGRTAEFWAIHQPALCKLELEEHSLVEEFKDLFENMVQI